MIDELVPDLLILSGFLFLLVVCGIFSDYVIPHCRPLRRFLERLFDIDLE